MWNEEKYNIIIATNNSKERRKQLKSLQYHKCDEWKTPSLLLLSYPKPFFNRHHPSLLLLIFLNFIALLVAIILMIVWCRWW